MTETYGIKRESWVESMFDRVELDVEYGEEETLREKGHAEFERKLSVSMKDGIGTLTQ